MRTVQPINARGALKDNFLIETPSDELTLSCSHYCVPFLSFVFVSFFFEMRVVGVAIARWYLEVGFQDGGVLCTVAVENGSVRSTNIVAGSDEQRRGFGRVYLSQIATKEDAEGSRDGMKGTPANKGPFLSPECTNTARDVGKTRPR